MSIKISHIDPDYMKKLYDLTKICYPDISIENLNKNDIRRLIRRFVRNKDIVLQSVHMLLRIKCPIFVYNDLTNYMKKIKFSNVNYQLDDISFSIPDNFKDKDKSAMLSLFKKVNSTLKSLSKDLPEKEITYILPMASIVTFDAYVDFLEIFDMVATINKSVVHPTTNEFIGRLFDLVNSEYPVFFTKQNLEIYIANKEK